MSGQIFFSYRRDDSSSAAGRLYDQLSARFVECEIFFDVDSIKLGSDFSKAIEDSVSSSDVLIAVIGQHWLAASDQHGKPRLNSPKDSVRIEIRTALNRGILVVPVLVEGASMPQPSELPNDLQSLTYRNALIVNNDRFRDDTARLVSVVEVALADARIQQEKKNLEGVKKLVVCVPGISGQYRYAALKATTARFNAHCGNPWVKAANSTPVLDLPEFCAYRWQPPQAFTREFSDLAFAEVFWADGPGRAANRKISKEETKGLIQSLVERVRLVDQSGLGKVLIDYEKATVVVDEVIDTIHLLESLLFLAKKIGLLEFDLGKLARDFCEDVQIVTGNQDFRGDIFRRFAGTMRNLTRRMPNAEQIYVIAHGEGTVVSLKAILTALSVRTSPENEWAEKVKGFMTIGSPLNNHVVMWPKLWEGLKPHPDRKRAEPIHWRNYYDYGDPIGYDLEITRQWMQENGWLPEKQAQQNTRKLPEDTAAPSAIFEFTDRHDYGFTCYPLPGEAHNDYWKDDGVFGHFIDNVIRGQKHAKAPTSIPWTVAISWLLPYVLCLGLITAGIYILYNTLVSVFFGNTSSDIIQDVAGITSLLAGSTVLSRIPRLDKVIPGAVFGAGAFLLGAIGYWLFLGYWQSVPSTARHLLDSAFLIPSGIVLYFLGASIGSAVISKLRPTWGMAPLITLGGVAAFIVLARLLSIDFSNNLPKYEHSLWALVIANAAFLYLWWLSASLFDLAYIWHRLIYSGAITKILRQLRYKQRTELRR